jgi:hypothetical protein
MIVQFLCALQTPLLYVYSFLSLGKIPNIQIKFVLELILLGVGIKLGLSY